MVDRVISTHFPYLHLLLYLEIGQRTEQVEALLDTEFDSDVLVGHLACECTR